MDFDIWRERVVKGLTINNTLVIVAIVLVVRLLTSFFYGTQDVEWWKAWYSAIDNKGITRVYGTSDSVNLSLLEQNWSFKQIRDSTQYLHGFSANDYFRSKYPVTQPPFYIYHVYIAGSLYKMVDPELTNNRIYNFFLNIIPVLYSLLTALLIFLFLRSTGQKELAGYTSLLYFINPLVLLNSPIQGFWDPILAFYVLLSLVFLYGRYLYLAAASLTLAVLFKPTAVIILPVFLSIVIIDYSFFKCIKGLLVAILTGLLLAIPYILDDHMIGMILGVTSIVDYSNDISRQSLNLWWSLQYYMNFIQSNTTSVVDLLLGQNFNWQNDVQASHFQFFNLKLLSLVLFILATIRNLYMLPKLMRVNRLYVFYFVFIQSYIYFIFRIGVQSNHYYIMFVFLSVIALIKSELFKVYLVVLCIFLFQDLIFYGFGRDLNVGVYLLTLLRIPLITVVLSVVNFFFLMRLLKRPIIF